MKRYNQHDNDLTNKHEDRDLIEQMRREFDMEPSEEFKERSFNFALQGIQEARKKATNKKKFNRAKKVRTSIGLVAAAILLSFTFFSKTDPVQAFISQVRQWFEPEKTIEQELEGMPEETDVNLHEGTTTTEQEADFVIYVDEERYQVTQEDDVFTISADLPEDYPEVSMEITQQVDVKEEEAIEIIKNEISTEYNNIGEITQVEEPVKGFQLTANNGNEWNDKVVVYYVVSNELEGSFIIKEQYFMEASEGHGARFYNMLKEFTVITGEDE